MIEAGVDLSLVGVGRRVLVVEDEELVRLILAETLGDAGFAVVEAATGDEAVELIDDPDGFDLIVTDIQMPGRLDGIGVGRHARAQDAGVPIVYVTGRPDSLSSIGSLGPRDAFVRKPYGPLDVMAAVDRLLAA